MLCLESSQNMVTDGTEPSEKVIVLTPQKNGVPLYCDSILLSYPR